MQPLKASAEEIAEHIDSLNAIPDYLITPEDRAFWIDRASQGLDVYAYHSGPGVGVWNVWDTETRIACAEVATAWQISGVALIGPERWRVFLARGTDSQVVDFWVHHHPIYDSPGGNHAPYEERCARVIRSAVQHINLFHDDPQKLQDCHF